MGRGRSKISGGGGGGVVDEMSKKGYVGLSGDESDKFMDTYHNSRLIHNGLNTMDGAQSRRINDAFRNGQEPSNPADKKLADRLDKEIQKNQLPQDMTLYRGMSLDAFAATGAFANYKPKTVSMNDFTKSDGSIDFAAWNKAYTAANAQNEKALLKMSKKLVGQTVKDDGFLQVSASSQRNIFGFSDVNLQLRAKKGTKAYISNYKEESEIILGRSSNIKIVGTSFATVKANNGASMRVLQVIADLV